MLDAGMLQDSCLNLVLNARDACLSTAAGAITLTARTVQDIWAEFSRNCDTGPGFSERSAIEHAFEPFFTTKGDEGARASVWPWSMT